MPLRKFRSVEEMPDGIWRQPGDPELYRVIRSLWDAGRRMRRLSFAPGLRYYGSIEEMDRSQQAGEAGTRRHSRTSCAPED
jgi:hypothetical protein